MQQNKEDNTAQYATTWQLGLLAYWVCVLLFVLYLLMGCSTPKSKVYTETQLKEKIDSVAVSSVRVEKDTVRIIKERIVTKPIHSSTFIRLECDEQGNVKPVQHQVSNGKNNLTAAIENNTLLLNQQIDSAVNERVQTYHASLIVDSISIAEKAIENYKQKQSQKIVKQPHWLLLHYKCGILIFLLSAFIVYLLRNKK